MLGEDVNRISKVECRMERNGVFQGALNISMLSATARKIPAAQLPAPTKKSTIERMTRK